MSIEKTPQNVHIPMSDAAQHFLSKDGAFGTFDSKDYAGWEARTAEFKRRFPEEIKRILHPSEWNNFGL
jgi:hypothetical protein